MIFFSTVELENRKIKTKIYMWEMQSSTHLNLDCLSSFVVQWNTALRTPCLLRPYSFDPNVVISDPVNATTSLLRPGFYCPTLVILTGFYYTVISKTRFSLHLGQTAFWWCIRDEPAGRPRKKMQNSIDWHVAPNISVIHHFTTYHSKYRGLRKAKLP